MRILSSLLSLSTLLACSATTSQSSGNRPLADYETKSQYLESFNGQCTLYQYDEPVVKSDDLFQQGSSCPSSLTVDGKKAKKVLDCDPFKEDGTTYTFRVYSYELKDFKASPVDETRAQAICQEMKEAFNNVIDSESLSPVSP